ncbi:hypothetical protein J6590_071546 [Homalodisca vitripennis]|nr:hypothetical protein J6590_071546 [Homalodisca vitripennis]
MAEEAILNEAEYIKFLGMHLDRGLTWSDHIDGVSFKLKFDFRTTTNDRAGGLLARTGSLSGHPSKQQPHSALLDLVIL